ncbi:MAG: hypothetical protein M3Q27_15705 [Actinomycetota bacterium]|nr:hypothetical protein [Actinomycetota bacterium]
MTATDPPDSQGDESPLRKAAALGDSAAMWQLAHALRDDVEGAHWQRRALEATYPRATAPGISVSSDLFPLAYDGKPWRGARWSVQVVSQDLRAVTALQRASERFMYAAEDGRELTEEEMDQNNLSMPALATASWVSPVRSDDDGDPYVTLDLDTLVAPLLARTLIEIVIDELVRAGVEQAHVQSPPLRR